MFTIMKRDYFIFDKSFYILMPIIAIILYYFTGYTNIWLALFLFIMGLFTPFVYDWLNKSYIAFDLLPVSRRTIVTSRYANTILFALISIIITFILNGLTHYLFDTSYLLNFKDFIALFSYFLILIAISLPNLFFYHRIYSFVATIALLAIIIVTFFFNIINLVIDQIILDSQNNFGMPRNDETIIFQATNQSFDQGIHLYAEFILPYGTYIFLPIIALISLILSYLISVYIFKRRDLSSKA